MYLKLVSSPPPPRPNNTGMPDNLKSGIESLSGFSMDDVRVHYNSSKPATVQALAYTQGTDIHVAPGQEKHLPHEAWHVAQQMAGRVSPTTNINGMPVNDNAGLEHEADVMGEKAMQCKNVEKDDACLRGPLNEVCQLVRVKEGVSDWDYCDYYEDLCNILLKKNCENEKITIGSEENTRKKWRMLLVNKFGATLEIQTFGRFLISNCQNFASVCDVCVVNDPTRQDAPMVDDFDITQFVYTQGFENLMTDDEIRWVRNHCHDVVTNGGENVENFENVYHVTHAGGHGNSIWWVYQGGVMKVVGCARHSGRNGNDQYTFHAKVEGMPDKYSR